MTLRPLIAFGSLALLGGCGGGQYQGAEIGLGPSDFNTYRFSTTKLNCKDTLTVTKFAGPFASDSTVSCGSSFGQSVSARATLDAGRTHLVIGFPETAGPGRYRIVVSSASDHSDKAIGGIDFVGCVEPQ